MNLEDVTRYLTFLDTEEEVFNYALFDSHTNNPIRGMGVLFGSRRELLSSLPTLKFPFTLHVTLNRTSLFGRKNKDVESVRVACVDIDREVSDDFIREAVAKYKPQMVVRSSPGKYHLYWKLSRSVTLLEWQELQAGLAYLLGGDSQLPALGHLIRVPGVPRITKTGQEFLPSIVYSEPVPLDPEKEFTKETLDLLIPELPDSIAQARTTREKERELLRNKFKRSKQSAASDSGFNGLGRQDLISLAKQENRNSTLYAVIKNSCFHFEPLSAAACELETYAVELGSEFNQLLDSHPKGRLGMEEVRSTVESAVRSALEARTKRAARLKLKADKVMEIQALAGKDSAEAQVEAASGAAMEAHVNGTLPGPAGAHFPNFCGYDFSSKELALSRYSEPSVVQRVLQRYGALILRCQEVLYAFDDIDMTWKVQNNDNSGILKDFILSIVNDMAAEEAFGFFFAQTKHGVDPHKLEVEINKWKTGGRINSILGVLRDSRTVTSMVRSPFDEMPYKYFCANGVLDLMTGKIRNAVAKDYLLRRSNVWFDPGAGFEWWDGFLREVFRDNADPIAVIKFLQEVFGYSLTGDIGEQMIFIHFGGGANGKSRILSALSALTGEYCGRLQPDSLGTRKSAAAKALERIAIKSEGKRVIVVDDLDSGMEWSEGLVKSLTERVLIARRLFEEERDIPNMAKVHIGCNEVPKVQNSSHAVYRRLAILEYCRRFPVNPAKFKEIEIRIEENLSGILNWAILGLKRILERNPIGIVYPEEVRYAVADYEDSNSSKEKKLLGLIRVISKNEANEAELQGDDRWVGLQEIFNFVSESGEFSTPGEPRMDLNQLGALLNRVGAQKRRVRSGGDKKREYAVVLLRKEANLRKFEDTAE